MSRRTKLFKQCTQFQACQMKILEIRDFWKKIRSLSGEFFLEIRRKTRRFSLDVQERLYNFYCTSYAHLKTCSNVSGRIYVLHCYWNFCSPSLQKIGLIFELHDFNYSSVNPYQKLLFFRRRKDVFLSKTIGSILFKLLSNPDFLSSITL